jgi:pyruvate/2-oxoglutarate/acetoin dehydrogenase E1 component
MNTLETLADTLADLLRADARRVLLGEDVADGGMLGLSRTAAADSELVSRLVSTPLAPASMLAHAGGLAMSGLRPIVLLPHAGQLLEGLAGLREVALLSWRTASELTAPMVVIVPTGPGFGLGSDATEGPEAMLARVPGLRVVAIGRASEAGAIVRAAADLWAGEEPTVVLLPRTIALQPVGDDVPAELGRPFARAHLVRPGTAATVFAWGECLELARQAVERTGLDAAIVDVGVLAPLDRSGLLDAARKTGKIVITHAGPAAGGIGAELAALFADEAILHLDAPVLRVTGAAAPLSASQEPNALPDLDRFTEAIESTAHFGS